MNLAHALRTAIAVCFAGMLLVACSGGGTYARGLFTGYVMGQTEEEIVGKMGKPDEIDRATPDKPRLIYKKKTFDPDNDNRVDEKVTIIMGKNPAGKMVATDLIFG